MEISRLRIAVRLRRVSHVDRSRLPLSGLAELPARSGNDANADRCVAFLRRRDRARPCTDSGEPDAGRENSHARLSVAVSRDAGPVPDHLYLQRAAFVRNQTVGLRMRRSGPVLE